jgi:hypothetical protein
VNTKPYAKAENHKRRTAEMCKTLIATTSLVITFATAAIASSGAVAAPTSPGACNMLNANVQGLAGMDGSQGGKNMVPLVVASLGDGCAP